MAVDEIGFAGWDGVRPVEARRTGKDEQAAWREDTGPPFSAGPVSEYHFALRAESEGRDHRAEAGNAIHVCGDSLSR